MNNTFLESIAQRRSIYDLGKEIPVSKEEITKTVEEAIRLSPSAFNSQSARLVILYGEESDRFWTLVFDALKPIVPEQQLGDTKNRIASFANGAGTILVFEDSAVIEQLQTDYALYAENFPVWSQHGSAIVQFSIWSALANIKIGSSLQHYSNLVEDEVKKEWSLPSSWSLIAQMPFGSIESPAGEKSFLPIEERVLVKG